MTDKHFEALRDGIRKELLKARDHFTIFWQLYEIPPELKPARNAYLIYFYYSMIAHNDEFLISIHNVIYKGKKTSNFHRLFCYIESNKNLNTLYPKGQFEKLREKIASHKELLNRIGLERNKYLAHNELKEESFKEIPIYKKLDGEKLLADLMDILNDVSMQYNHRYYDSGWVPHFKCLEMLQELQTYRESKGLNKK